MNYLIRLTAAVAALAMLTGCIAPSARSKPRLFGDNIIVKEQPPNVVVPNIDATGVVFPEQTLSINQPTYGYIWNVQDRCTVGVGLPRGYFEVSMRTEFGPCPASVPDGYSDVSESYDEQRRQVCDYWQHVNVLPMVTNTRSPKLRAPGFEFYDLELTYTPLNGRRRPYGRIHTFNAIINPNQPSFRGKYADWHVVIDRCPS